MIYKIKLSALPPGVPDGQSFHKFDGPREESKDRMEVLRALSNMPADVQATAIVHFYSDPKQQPTSHKTDENSASKFCRDIIIAEIHDINGKLNHIDSTHQFIQGHITSLNKVPGTHRLLPMALAASDSIMASLKEEIALLEQVRGRIQELVAIPPLPL